MADNMQNEAMERLKQMYSKATPQVAQNTAPQHSRRDGRSHQQGGKPQTESSSSHQSTSSIAPPTLPSLQSSQKAQTETKTVHTNEQTNLLDIFMRDKEKSLIVLLIVILISEKADTTLILALMYLIL